MSDTVKIYTDAEATDLGVLMLVRRLRRTDRGVFDKVIASLPQDVRDSLDRAEMRADVARDVDRRDGITRRYMTDAERYGEN